MTIKDGIILGIGLVIGRNVCTIISDTLAKCIAKTDIYKNYIHKTDEQKPSGKDTIVMGFCKPEEMD